MKRGWLLVVGLLLSLLGATACSSPSGQVVPFPEVGVVRAVFNQQVGIWVAGEGKAMAEPDIVSLRLGVEAQAATVSEAQQKAAEAMVSVREALTHGGVEKKDIQTYRFSIQPVRKWDRQTEQEILVGYRVSNMVAAKVREVEKVGEVIDAVAEAGGDFIRINNISFDIDDPIPFYEEAREKAVKDATAKAERLAELAGVKLGKPIYISEGREYTPSPRMAEVTAEASAPMPTPISPGEMEISLNVQIAFEIEG